MNRTSAFRLLGLQRNASEAQVKRAYAALLRKHRPEDDAVAFQHLNEAYQACLEHVRRHARASVDVPMAITHVPPMHSTETVAHAHAPAWHVPGVAVDIAVAPSAAPANTNVVLDTFDPDAFADECIERMRVDPPFALDAWLQSHEALYSLERKQALRPLVVQVLAGVEPEIAARHFDQVTRFFGLDTVGVDSRLRQQLDHVQRRIGDASRFEHHLRLHSSRHASWTDRQLAKDVFGPSNGLRRLFLILTPGLPGRVGALVRNLRMADPETSAARLDQNACRFWERATDRSRVARERLLLAGLRALLFSGVIAAYATAIDVNGTFGRNWIVCLLGTLLPWLAYAVVVAGFIRFSRFNQTRLYWDMPTLLACVGTLASAIATQLQPIAGIIGFAVTGLLWLGARGNPGSQANASAWATIATAAGAFLLAAMCIDEVAGDAVRARHAFALAGIYTMAVLILHDIAFARRRRIPLQAAHLATGWLWWAFAGHVVMLAMVGWLSPN